MLHCKFYKTSTTQNFELYVKNIKVMKNITQCNVLPHCPLVDYKLNSYYHSFSYPMCTQHYK